MSICIIQLPSDFEERYKKYRGELGDQHTKRTLDVVSEAQERAARDLAIVSGQLDIFASQFSVVAAIQEDMMRHGTLVEAIAKDIEARQKVFEAFTRSMTPILDVARDAQRTIEQLGIGKSLEQLRGPIEQLNISTTEIARVVDSVQMSVVPPIGEVVLPMPKKLEKSPVPVPTSADSNAVLLAQVKELVGIVRTIEQKIPARGKDTKHHFPFPLSASIQWESIYIGFVNAEAVDIQVGGRVHRTGYADMGFADQRTGNANMQWGLLLVLARHGGELKASDADASPKLVKQTPQRVFLS
jgi:hypothetical protein